MTSEPRLPFDVPSAADRIEAAAAEGQARPKPLADAAARAHAVDPAQQRRARSLGRHREDARPRGALRQPAARRRRSGPHPRHHVHAEGGGRDAAADPRAPARGEPHLAARRRALARPARAARRHRHLHDRRLLPVAAPRVPARGRRRPGFRPRRRDRGRRGSWARRSTARSASAAAWRGPTRTWRSCSCSSASGACASGLAALARAAARRGRRPAPRFLASGPRDVTPRTACERAARRCATSCGASRAGCRSSLADGPCRGPEFAMLARICVGLCDGRRAAGRRRPRGAGGVPRARSIGSARYFLTQDGEPRGERFSGTGFGPGDCDSPGRVEAAPAGGVEIARAAVADALKAFRRDLNVVLARGVRRMFAVAVSQYTATLDAARRARLLRSAAARPRAAAADGGVLPQPLPARGAVSPRARRRVPGHEPRAVGAGVAARPELGRGARRLGRAPSPPSIFIVGDRKQSIYGFRDAEVAVLDDAARIHRRPATRAGSRARPSR